MVRSGVVAFVLAVEEIFDVPVIVVHFLHL